MQEALERDCLKEFPSQTAFLCNIGALSSFCEVVRLLQLMSSNAALPRNADAVLVQVPGAVLQDRRVAHGG